MATEFKLPYTGAQLNQKLEKIDTLSEQKLGINGGVMTGELVAQNKTNYSTKQVRNIIISTADPTESDGDNGDIWIKYEG